jgi:hypothetical protein
MASLIRDVWFLLSALLRWMKQEVGSLLQCGRNPVDAAVAQAAKHAGFHVLIIGAGTVWHSCALWLPISFMILNSVQVFLGFAPP